MDAAQKTFRNTAVLFPLALLALAAPLSAQQFSLNTTSVTLVNVPVSVTVNSTDASKPITFTVSNPDYSGDANNPGGVQWLSVSPASGTTPNSMISFSISNTAGLPVGTHTANVKLHATTPASGVTDQTITVSFTVGGGGGGGGGTGNISASSTALTFNASPGGFAQNQQINLTTSSATPIGFSISQPSQSWLTVSANNTQVSSGIPAALTVSANASSLGNGTYYGNFSINPNGGSSIPVTVTFIVGTGGGGTGSFQLSTSSLNLSYPTGTNAGSVYVTSSALSNYTVTPSSSNGWLLVNGSNSAFNASTNQYLNITLGSQVTVLGTGNYTGTITLTNPTNTADFATIYVYLSVNGGGGSGSGVLNPATLNFSAGFNSAPQQQNVSVTGTVNGANIGTCNGNVVGLSQSSTTTNTFVVTVYPAAISTAGTYSCSLAFTVNSTAYSLPLNLTVSSGGGGGTGTGGTVAPTSLTFAYQAGQSGTPYAQQILVNNATVSSVNTSYSTGSNPFISANSSGNAVAVTVLGSLPAGTYSGAANIVFTNGGSQSVPVTLNVTSGPVILSNPGNLSLNYTAGSTNPTATIQILSSDNSTSFPLSASSNASWVVVGSPTSSSTPASYPVSINASGLANGLNTAAITFTATGANNTPLTLPVVILVSGSSGGGTGSLTLGASSLTFSGIVNGTQPSAQTLGVSAASATTFNASVTGSNCGWLSIAPSGSLTTPQNLTVNANQTGLAANTYSCNISLTANGQTQTVPVSFVVSTTGGGGGAGNVTVSPTSLTFNYTQGGATPGVQALSVASTSGSAPVTVTLSANTTSGGNWLSIGVANGTQVTTPISALAVGVNATVVAALAAGTYNGSVVISPNGGTQVTVPVTLTVQSLTVTATPSTLTFSYRAGDQAPAAQNITVGGPAGLPFTATASSQNNWLSISPTSGTTPGTVAVSIDTSKVQAGNYTGTVTVAGSGTATGTNTITVNLTVTAPLPTISAVTNGASFAPANTVSAGEVITIFGTNIGPSQPALLALDANGKVSTSIGGVQVLVGGYPAPMIYASSTQVSAVVPYEIASPIFVVSPNVQIRYVGQTSNGIPVTQAASAPGIFTANSSGTGPGAILNANASVNSPSNPANKGETVVLYMTGEGQTNPAGISGSVTAVTTLPNGTVFTPQPLLPVAVTIDGQPAQVTFWGQAPGIVAGVMQVNVVIPQASRSGNVPVVVRVGGQSTQNDVTVSVR